MHTCMGDQSCAQTGLSVRAQRAHVHTGTVRDLEDIIGTEVDVQDLPQLLCAIVERLVEEESAVISQGVHGINETGAAQ